MNLHDFILYNNINKLKKELKKSDINLNIKNEFGFTPFFHACGNANLEIAQLLIQEQKL